MKVATCLLNDEGMLSLKKALSADKRADSRAELVYTDAVALLPSSPPDSGETTLIASAAQRISKIEKSARNQSAYASAQEQRVRCAKGRRARAAAENFWRLCKCPTRRHCDVKMLVRRERGYIGKGQS
jgi:hypothetical protein